MHDPRDRACAGLEIRRNCGGLAPDSEMNGGRSLSRGACPAQPARQVALVDDLGLRHVGTPASAAVAEVPAPRLCMNSGHESNGASSFIWPAATQAPLRGGLDTHRTTEPTSDSESCRNPEFGAVWPYRMSWTGETPFDPPTPAPGTSERSTNSPTMQPVLPCCPGLHTELLPAWIYAP